MPIRKEYHCLIAGLPDLVYDERKTTLTIGSLREMLMEALTPEDLALVSLYLGRYDNHNLLAYLADTDSSLDTRGTLTTEDFEDIIEGFREGTINTLTPEWFKTFLPARLEDQPLSETLSWEDQLTSLYYEYLLEVENPFLREYFTFEFNVSNILSAILSRQYGLNPADAVLGDGPVATQLRSSQAKDFGLSGQVDFLDQVMRITEETNLLERERKIDLLRWGWLDENVFFHYFTIEKVFSILIKLEIVERWLKIDPDFGQKRFRELLDSLQASYEFPDEYKRKK